MGVNTKNDRINVRINSRTKYLAEQKLAKQGITIPQFVNMELAGVVNYGLHFVPVYDKKPDTALNRKNKLMANNVSKNAREASKMSQK